MRLWLHTYWPALAVLAVSAAAGAYVGWRHGIGWGVVSVPVFVFALSQALLRAEDSGRREERAKLNGGR